MKGIILYRRYCSGLRGFLKNEISLEESKKIIEMRMENREENFLKIMEKGIYENRNSPYRSLLKHANYSFKDVKSLVLDKGIEETLENLRRDGVYITVDEFKGKKPVVRKGHTFNFREKDFDNTLFSQGLEVQSGATRSTGTRTFLDFEFLSQTAPHMALVFDAHGVLNSPIIMWVPILPASSGIWAMLLYAKIGNPPIRWFSQVDERSIKPSLKSRIATNFTVYMGRLFGVKLPKPEFVNLNNALKVAECIAETIKSFSKCTIFTYASSAVRICTAAEEHGLEIDGASFLVCGEPITQTKRQEMESTGATVIPDYGFTEGGVVGLGCPKPCAPDDVHLFKDSFAAIQHERKVEHADISVNAFLFTSLLTVAPKILLNVESDDYGVIESRSCGCKLEEIGFSDHIYNIRSFGKLTGEGMTFVGTDLIGIVEEVLPRKFGGSSTDYQVLEEEDDKGFTRVSIVISPTVGKIDERDFKETVFHELGGTNSLMVNIWSQADTIRVKRMHPIPTKRGKIMPFHIKKQ